MPRTVVRPGIEMLEVLSGRRVLEPIGVRVTAATGTELHRHYKERVKVEAQNSDNRLRARAMTRSSFGIYMYQAKRMRLIYPVSEAELELVAISENPLVNPLLNIDGNVVNERGNVIAYRQTGVIQDFDDWTVVESRRIYYALTEAGRATLRPWQNLTQAYRAYIGG